MRKVITRFALLVILVVLGSIGMLHNDIETSPRLLYLYTSIFNVGLAVGLAYGVRKLLVGTIDWSDNRDKVIIFAALLITVGLVL